MPKEKLPCAECGGRCCKLAPFTTREYKKVRSRIPQGANVEDIEFAPGSVPGVGGLNPGKVIIRDGVHGPQTCAFLSPHGCVLGEDRPRVCRIYGEHSDHPCVFLHPDADNGIGIFISDSQLLRFLSSSSKP